VLTEAKLERSLRLLSPLGAAARARSLPLRRLSQTIPLADNYGSLSSRSADARPGPRRRKLMGPPPRPRRRVHWRQGRLRIHLAAAAERKALGRVLLPRPGGESPAAFSRTGQHQPRCPRKRREEKSGGTSRGARAVTVWRRARRPWTRRRPPPFGSRAVRFAGEGYPGTRENVRAKREKRRNEFAKRSRWGATRWDPVHGCVEAGGPPGGFSLISSFTARV
jgi:hypothetical protein